MYATFRRIKPHPGRAGDVAAPIEAGYAPMVRGVRGFVSYTLVDVGDDEVASVGTFSTPEAAAEANTVATQWTADRLAPLVATPLEARAGAVLVGAEA